jgi:hypothetical protein
MKNPPRVDPLEDIIVLRGFALAIMSSCWVGDSRDLLNQSSTLKRVIRDPFV